MNPLMNDLLSNIWAMDPRRLDALVQRLASAGMADPQAGVHPPAAAAQEAEASYDVRGGTAAIAITGVIRKTIPWFYSFFGIDAVTTGDIKASIQKALGDDDVKNILLYIDSPGGTVDGTQELADYIYESRDIKPIRAHISDLGASGAYWFASQASAVSANQAARVGSIGVYIVVVDDSEMYSKAGVNVRLIRSGEYKGVGASGVPITDKELKPQQEIVDGLAEIFVDRVARGRNMPAAAVKALATGRLWLSGEALSLGLIDRVKSYDPAVAWVDPEPSDPQPVSAGDPAGDVHVQTLSASRKETDMPGTKEDQQAPAPAAAPAPPPVALTVESLKADHPDLVEALMSAGREAGIKDERERIANIQGLAFAGQEDLVEELVASGAAAQDAATRIIADQKDRQGKVLDALKDGGAPIVGQADPADAGGGPKSKAEKAWDADPALREDFGVTAETSPEDAEDRKATYLASLDPR